MAFKLKIKTNTSAPSSGALDSGELGYNTSSDILYIGNGAGNNATEAITNSSTAQTKVGDFTTQGKLGGEYLELESLTGTSPTTGQITYDTDSGTFRAGLYNNYVLDLGEKHVMFIENTSGSTIAKGAVVGFAGSAGDHLRGSAFTANSSANPNYIMGIADQSIANNASGFVVVFGKVRGIDTSAYSAGTVLYASAATAGALTSTEPSAPNLKLPIAAVISQNASSGIIQVRMKTGERLATLHDVNISSPSSGQVLSYDGSKWANTTLAGFTDTYLSSASFNTSTGVLTLTKSDASTVTVDLDDRYVELAGDTMTGTLVIENDLPIIRLNDTSHENDYEIRNANGSFSIYDLDAAAYRLLVNSTGNVGIGTTSPSQKLDVEGNGRFNGDVYGSRFLDLNNTTYKLDPANSDTSLVVAGKVGIGTTSPSQKLDVNGNAAISGDIYLNNDNSPAGADPTIYFGDDESDTAHYLQFDDSDQQFVLSNSLSLSGNLNMTSTVSHPGNSTPTALAYGKLTGYGTFYINADTDGSTSEYLYLTAGYGQGAGGSNEGMRIGYAENSLTWKGHRVFTDNYHPNADVLTTARTISLNTGAVGTATSFNGSANIAIPVTGVSESYLTWGGKNLSGQVTPIGMSLSNEHSANRLAFINGDSLYFEYSADSGSTWTDYEYSASTKSQWCTTSFGLLVGRTSGEYYTTSQTRVTLTAQNGTTGYVYTNPRKMLINISSSGGMQVLVETRTGANYQSNGSWSTYGTYTLSGWSGWNDIPLVLSTLGGGTTQTGNTWQLRLTFIMTSKNSTYPTTAQVNSIRIFGENAWIAPSTLAGTNNLYTYDMSQNASFPAAIQGTQLTSTVATGTAPLTVTSTTNVANLNADLLDGLNSTDFLRIYRGSTTLTNLDTYYRIARVEGDVLSSSIRMTLTGTTGSVVVNVIADILVNHSQDIVINSQSGEYTQVTIKIQSNNNEDFDIYVKYNSGNAGLSIQTEIISYTNDTVTLNPSATAYTGFSREHTTVSGTLNAQALEVSGNTVWHAGNDGASSGLDADLLDGQHGSYYAPIASPALTGTPTAPTAAANTNTTQIATTAYVQTEIADLINSAPGALDTLDELAAALGDDANFATTVTSSIATKLPLAGGTMTGNILFANNSDLGIRNAAGTAAFYLDDSYGNTYIKSDSSVYLQGNNFYFRNPSIQYKFFVNGTNGHVGIGTTGPATKLHIADAGTQELRIENTNTTVGLSDVIGTLSFRSNDASTGGTGIAGSISSISEASSGVLYGLAFNTKNFDSETEKMRITYDGKVGIGTTSPATTLQVNGNVLLGSTYTTPSGSPWNTTNAQMILGGAHNAEFNNGSAVKLLITGHNNDSPTDMYPIFVEDENGLDDFWLRARASGSSGATMYLDGSFGIGTTSPSEKLHVAGNIVVSQLISTVATGTAPLTVTSTTAVTNLNADLLDGNHASDFYLATNPSGYTTNTGTVTSVATGGGLTGGTITTSGTISHADTSSQASVNNSNGTVIQDVTLDTYGHVTGLESVDLDSRYLTRLSTSTLDVNAANGTQLYTGSTSSWTNRGPYGNNAGALLSLNTHPGNYYSQLWFDTAGGSFYHRTSNGVLPTGSWREVWDSGNDGASSGLDADLLDGQHASDFAAASHTHDDLYYTETEADSRFVNTAGDTMTGTLGYTVLNGPGTSTRDKVRLYNSDQYAIGMQSTISYGGLNDWAMTFQFNDDDDRGFWWGDTAHTTAQGAMSLTTSGKLTVADGIRVGYGTSDTTTPSSGLDVSGTVKGNDFKFGGSGSYLWDDDSILYFNYYSDNNDYQIYTSLEQPGLQYWNKYRQSDISTSDEITQYTTSGSDTHSASITGGKRYRLSIKGTYEVDSNNGFPIAAKIGLRLANSGYATVEGYWLNDESSNSLGTDNHETLRFTSIGTSKSYSSATSGSFFQTDSVADTTSLTDEFFAGEFVISCTTSTVIYLWIAVSSSSGANHSARLKAGTIFVLEEV